tara:strand:- start:29249 stop:32458 length:3210 start_codon:yes stop_codon:yes gene_type:complete
MKKTSKLILQAIAHKEAKADATCWTTVRMMEHFYAGRELSEHAALLKIEVGKLILFSLWARASNTSRKCTLSEADITNILPKQLKPEAQVHLSPTHKIHNPLLRTKLRHYHRITENWRLLLSLALEQMAGHGLFASGKQLKPLSRRAAQLLAQTSTHTTIDLLNKARKISIKRSHRHITVKDIQAAYVHFKKQWKLANHKGCLGGLHLAKTSSKKQSPSSQPKKQRRQTQVSTRQHLHKLTLQNIEAKIRSLKSRNRLVWKEKRQSVRVLINRIIPDVTLTKDGFESLVTLLEKTAGLVGAGYLPMRNDTYMLFQTYLQWSQKNPAFVAQKHRPKHLLNIEWVFRVIEQLIPRKTLANGDVHFYLLKQRDQKNTHVVKLLGYQLDAVRDTTLPWWILKRVWKKHPSMRALGPFAAELLVERISELALLFLQETRVMLQRDKQRVLNAASLNKRMSSHGLGIAMLPPPRQHIKWPKPLLAQKKQLLKSYPRPLFRDVTNTAGLITQRCEANNYPIISLPPGRKIHSVGQVNSAPLQPTTRPTSQSTKPTLLIDRAVSVAGHQAYMGAGIGVGDLDGDGRVDLFFAGEGCNRLYQNMGSYRFRDITEKVGLRNWKYDSRQALFIDANADGKMDLFVVHSHSPSKLFLQQPNGTLVDATKKSNIRTHWGAHTATFFDYDGDGDLDLYIGYYGTANFRGPAITLDGRNARPNQLYQNMGRGVFREVAAAAGVASRAWTLAVTAVDINKDGRPDLYLANDFGRDQLFINRGHGTFKEVARRMKTDDRGSGMNVSVTDINADGYWDVYVSVIDMFSKNLSFVMPGHQSPFRLDDRVLKTAFYISGNKMFINQKGRGFSPSERRYFEPGQRGWGWSTNFFDYENDGDEDLYLANGWIPGAPGANQRNQLFLRWKSRYFHVHKTASISYKGNSRSVAAVDLTGTGRMDLLLNDYIKGPRIFRNMQPATNHWLKVRLVGTRSNQRGIGATIRLFTTSLPPQMRLVHAGSHYLSQEETTVTFGLGTKARAKRIEVYWPDGYKQVYKGPFKKRTTITIHEDRQPKAAVKGQRPAPSREQK